MPSREARPGSACTKAPWSVACTASSAEPRAAPSPAAVSSTPDALGSAISAEASDRSSLERIVYWCGRWVISRRISRKSPEAA